MAFLLVGGASKEGERGESRSSRHGKARAAAVLAFCGLVAACSPVPGEPAPVYMMGARPTAYQSMASAPIQQAMAPVALAPGPSTSSRHLAPDVIPLDNPPPTRAASPAGAPVHRVTPPATASRSPPAAPPSVRARTEPEAGRPNPPPAALPHGPHFSCPLNEPTLA